MSISVNNIASALPDFYIFDVMDLTNAGPRWKQWINWFELMLSAMNIISTSTADKARKRSLLLHYICPDAYDVYETLEDAETPTYKSTKKALTDYFTQKTTKNMKGMCFATPNRKKVRQLICFAQDYAS